MILKKDLIGARVVWMQPRTELADLFIPTPALPALMDHKLLGPCNSMEESGEVTKPRGE